MKMLYDDIIHKVWTEMPMAFNDSILDDAHPDYAMRMAINCTRYIDEFAYEARKRGRKSKLYYAKVFLKITREQFPDLEFNEDEILNLLPRVIAHERCLPI